MNKLSSNSKDMLEALGHIRRVNVSDSLYQKITDRIAEHQIIPLYKLRAVAAACLCIMATEIYLSSDFTTIESGQGYESLVSLPSNALYHE